MNESGTIDIINIISLFPCLQSLNLTRVELGEFETVMQTFDYVSGLHNFREFSQPSECLGQAMLTRKKCSIA